ncbi:MAG: ABC transporter permease subunit [Myxococcota bacterium]
MSPPAPSIGAGIGAIYRLQVKRIVRGKRLRLGVVAVVLVLIAILATRYSQDLIEVQEVMKRGVALGFFTLLVYLLPFLLNSGAIAEEVEARTLHYLLARPVGRLSVTVGKYLAGSSVALGLLIVGLLILHVGVYISEPGLMVEELGTTLRSAGALTLLTLLYGALCMFWGALAPEASGVVSALWLGIIEFAFGLLPGVFRYPSMNYMATELAGLPKGGIAPDGVPDIEPWVAIAAITTEMLIFLGLAVLTVGTSEYRFGKA